ncbi:dynein axonemal heavy chain 6-like [Hypomesus transpacificus]|uniref:dynein axonemal heavy chain 6-like n=1 Tax=Hypomesus transpacificus TaxID=137520 RepID=UPI001F078504|nr:dynein axonemal heavy chain 6-like [Hypomesus transpacificus]
MSVCEALTCLRVKMPIQIHFDLIDTLLQKNVKTTNEVKRDMRMIPACHSNQRKKEPACANKFAPRPIKKGNDTSVPATWNYRGKRVNNVLYDSKEPENDCVINHIIRLRKKLGWSTEIPDRRIMRAVKPNMNSQRETTEPAEDTGEYIYCLKRFRHDTSMQSNPYDLQVVSVQTAKQNLQYWTVSASSIFKVSVLEDRRSEIIPVMDWLSERKLFNKIFKLPFFKKFRIWKAFTIWKVTVCHSKFTKSKDVLCKDLFIVDEVFLRCLVEIKGLFEMAKKNTRHKVPGSPIVLTKLDRSVTYSLPDFCEVQTQQCAVALKQLHCLHDRVASLILSACMKAAEKQGAERLFLPLASASARRPLYCEVGEWRSLLRRFGRLLNLVDRMFEELLCHLVKTAACLLLSFLQASYNGGGECQKGHETKNKVLKPSSTLKDQTLSVKTIEPDIKKKDMAKTEIKAVFIVNVLLSVMVPESKELRETVSSSSTTRQSPETTEDTEDSKQTIHEENMAPHRSPSKSAKLCIHPSPDDFEQQIQNMLQTFEQVIADQMSFNQDPRLLALRLCPVFDRKLSVDDNLDKESAQNVRPWPDLELLLGTDGTYQSDLSRILRMVQKGVDGVEKHCQKTEKFCGMVDAAMLTDIDAFLAGEKWSSQDIRALLAMHTENVRLMENMEMEARVNMMLVSCKQYQRNCLLYPEALLTSIHRTLPAVAQRKNLELMEVIRGVVKKLDKDLVTVEEFVEHLTILSRICVQMPSLVRQYQFLIQLYCIFKEYNISISPEELALYQHLVPSFQHLKSAVMICETKKDDNVFKFSADVSKQLNQLRYDLVLVKKKVNNPILLCSSTPAKVAKNVLQTLSGEATFFSSKAHSYTSYGELLSNSYSSKAVMRMKQPRGHHTAALEAELSEVDCALSLLQLLWDMQDEWDRQHFLWRTTTFELLNVDDLQSDVSRFVQSIYMLEKGLPENDIVPTLKLKVMDFKLCLPIIVALRNPYLCPRHWADIQSNIGRCFIKEENFTLGNLLDLKILQFSDFIGDISTTATNEATLEGILHRVVELWRGTDFRLVTHQLDTSTVKIIASADEVMAQLEESQTTIMSVKASPYAGPIKQLIEEWERKLNQFSHTLQEWVTCQKKWLYLEPIFSAGGIQKQLPSEARVFLQVDKSWREMMQRTEDRPNALRAATAPGVLEVLQTSNVHLEKIHKCLEDYLESKRMVFPRFYFLSNEELLDVLSQSKNPDAIQPHLAKCFSNIHHLDIQEQASVHSVVVSVQSAEGEIVAMPKNVHIRGPVEQWMGYVETAVYNTVKRHLKMGVTDWKAKDFKKWVLSHPGQVILTVTQIMFTKDCVACFGSGDNVQERLVKVVKQPLGQSVEELADLVSQPLPFHQQATVEALLTTLVHCRDILSHLIQLRISSSQDFEWSRQLHYDWHDSTSVCYVIHAKASFIYGYEYLGCSPRLVITPLTDRCWLTLTGAISLHLGGAPAGPSGTGKTETVKDLAKALGKFCLVMNCFDSLDHKMMGKLLSGMVQSGCWCCFDEFNFINVEVLSVIAAQLQAIQAAKHSHSLRFVFEGRDIRLNESCGFFITMNPGCVGRVDLPDNLKSLFRPVAMMVPDFDLIAEIILFSGGFQSAKSLSRKIVNLYRLASKQLSQQDHYDFGMRAIKSVLVLAVQRRRQAAMLQVLQSEEESQILIRTLQDSNLPRLISEDVPLFQSIMDDLFPGIFYPKTVYPCLEMAIARATEMLGFMEWPNQAEKITQLYSQILARGGVMLVGPTGGGKTTARLILQHALLLLPAPSEPQRRNNLFMQMPQNTRVHVESFTINPKCVSLGELYGQVDPSTMEWSDGLVASAVRAYAKELFNNDVVNGSTYPPATSHPDSQPPCPDDAAVSHWRWVVMDGPVDVLWVENLNTVLDDNRTLCLVNGERICLPAGIRFLFEVDTLCQASPATISRCAMVYMDPVDLGWKPYVDRWLSQLPRQVSREARAYLLRFFNHSMTQGLLFIKKHQKQLSLSLPEISIVMTLCSILGGFINFMQTNGGLGFSGQTLDSESEEEIGKSSENQNDFSSESVDDLRTWRKEKWFLEKYPEKLTVLLGKLFVFAYVWAVGGVLNHIDDLDDSSVTLKDKSDPILKVGKAFKTLIQQLFEGATPCSVTLPAGNRGIFNFFVDLQTGAFVPWDDLVPSNESLIRKGLKMSSGSETAISRGTGKSKVTDANCQQSELICSLDTVRYSFIMSLLLLNKQPVLLTGDSGVGKTMIIQSVLKQLQKDGRDMSKLGTILGKVFLHNQAKSASLLEDVTLLTAGYGGDVEKSVTGDSQNFLLGVLGKIKNPRQHPESSRILTRSVQCTAQTSTTGLQANLLQNLVRKGKNKVLLFVDDLNMPMLDSYGAQPSMELIRQFIELQGLYDTKTLTWKGIQNVTLCAACGPPGCGRQELSPRLLRHFSVLALPQPSTSSMQHIFQVQLGQYFELRDFSKEVRKCRGSLVSASIAVYSEMCQHMLPTPAKYHYIFNLRDVAKVIQGLMQADDSELISEEAMAYLFAHEASRVFQDRLVCDQDRELFHQILSNELQFHFKVSCSPEDLLREPIRFGDFLDPNIPACSRVYKQMADLKKIQVLLEECHLRNGRKSSQFPMVFFPEAVEHIMRAARVFRIPGAHVMLIGLDGTGKEECVTLACRVSDCHLYKMSVPWNCCQFDFRDNLRRVFRQAGVHRRNTVLYITDADLVQDSVLEDLNCILKCGDVPGLFDNDEIDSFSQDLKTSADGCVRGNRDDVYSYFIQQVRQRLHIVVAVSPAGQHLRQYCRTHPSLLTCCYMDWYSDWSSEALLQVASSSCIDSSDFDSLGKVLQEKIARGCVDIHNTSTKTAVAFLQETRRPYYIVPSTFITYIVTFTNMYQSERSKLHNIRARFSNGLDILLEMTSLVTLMQEELVELGPQIEEKSKEVETLMEKLKEDSRAVSQVRAIVKREEEIMTQETQVVHEYAEAARADLNKGLPLLERAVSALDALEKSDISEIRVYTNPPDLVLTVMHAVCILLQETPSWPTAKQLLGDPGFLKKLVSLDKDSIPDRVFVLLRRYSKTPGFTPQKVGKVSVACRSMCLWVLALERYHDVSQIMKPKQRKVEVAQEALVIAQTHLRTKKSKLLKIEQHQRTLEDRFNASVSERKELGIRKELTTSRLLTAAALISALSKEKNRWEAAVAELNSKLKNVVGDVMMSAAFITYCGPLMADYRKSVVKQWLYICHSVEIPVSAQYSFLSSMTDKNQVSRWRNTGLPPDRNSSENAVMVESGGLWPLLIDPQGQATRWVCSMEGARLRRVTASDANLMSTLERAIRMGDPVLIQDVQETIDPCLHPILMKDIIIREGQSLIKVGDTEIEYNPNFRLYLVTRLPNPHFLPAVCILTRLISFWVEREGLQEQLLSSAVSLLRPRLEEEHGCLLHTITADLSSLYQMENRSLLLLQGTRGHILDDQDLIENLQNSRVTAFEISMRLDVAKEQEKEMDEVRRKFLPIANRGADLYFVLAHLPQINCMYQFSLDWFKEMYMKAIQLATGGQEGPSLDVSNPVTGTLRPDSARSLRKRDAPILEDFSSHLLRIMDVITETIYKEVSLALFTDHQLCFSFLICRNILQTKHLTSPEGGKQEIHPEEWRIFLHSAVLASIMDAKRAQRDEGEPGVERPDHLWLTDSMWAQCQYLSAQLACFAHLHKSIQINVDQWALFRSAANLYEFLREPYICDTDADQASTKQDSYLTKCFRVFPWENLSGFQRIILIKVLRPECLTLSVRAFVTEKMGSKYLEGGQVSLREVYHHCTANTPIVFILSPGVDPASQLVRLAQELRGSSLHLDMVSLGQGQGPRANELIYQAQVLKGRWVFLQNCHLAASFMPRLQNIVNSLKGRGLDLDPHFRLWLSSKPDPGFPASVLQSTIKVGLDPPRGVKEKLLHTFSPSGEASERTFSQADCSPHWKSLLFSLCFFNAIVQERAKFGPLGWNVPYTFTSSDLEVSIMNQERLLRGVDGCALPWAALCYLTGEVTYGGRVTDPWDRRCLMAVLQHCYSPLVLQEGHGLCPAPGYPAFPREASWAECRSYVEHLPDQDLAQAFGMDNQAEAVVLHSQSQLLLHNILAMQPRLSDSSSLARDGQSQDGDVLQMASYILKKLPETVEADHVTERTLLLKDIIVRVNTAAEVGAERPSMASLALTSSSLASSALASSSLASSALVVVLRQELDRFNRLLRVARSCLLSVCSALRGELLMSPSLEEVCNALLSMLVPSAWQHCSYESCQPLGSWVLDLEQRVYFFRLWADHIKTTLMESGLTPGLRTGVYSLGLPAKPDQQSSHRRRKPRSYWLSGFFFPQGFLTAVLQDSSRQKNLAVDSLSLTYRVQPSDASPCAWSKEADKTKLFFEGSAPPGEGVLVYGLYLAGAGWDPLSHSLQELQPNVQHCPLPEMHVLPCLISEDKAVPPPESVEDPQLYECPLYRTSQRGGSLSTSGTSSNFVTAVSLPSREPAAHWILRGAALLCQLDN